MVKTKTKRNGGRSPGPRDFKIGQGPIVHVAKQAEPADVNYPMRPIRMYAQPFLFAIARDPRTIFVNWNIDWQSAFEKAMPADRQVHLRVIGVEDSIETKLTVEPMSAMQYVTTSGIHKSYRVEIGYFQPFDTWHSVAMSGEVEMPPQGSAPIADVDLATVPFHLSFQQLAGLFGETNNGSVANLVSHFQKRVLSSDRPNERAACDTQTLGSLNLSLRQIATAHRNFRNIDTEKLTRRALAVVPIGRGQSGASIRSESSWSSAFTVT
jgi:hypothetical protein